MSQTRNQKIEAARSEIRAKYSLYQRVFSTPDGKEVLADLEKTFLKRSNLVVGDPYATHVRVGHSEVILFVQEKIEESENVD